MRYYSKSDLKRFGWTDKIIDKYLLTSDIRVDNPHNEYGEQMYLYSEEHITKVENSLDFKNDFEQAQRRKRNAKIPDEELYNNMLHYVKTVRIEVPHYTNDSLEWSAREAYEENHLYPYRRLWDEDWTILDNEPWECASEDMPDEVICLICQIYLRHQLKEYEKDFYKQFYRVATIDAINILHARIEKKISEVYPHLYIDKYLKAV